MNEITPAEESVLQPGVNMSWQPYMRVERARALLLALLVDTRQWSRSGAAHGTLHLTEDPTTLELRLEVVHEPPLDEWSMRLGEALHHLRAAFDGLAWDIAHIDGATPLRPSRVDFPVVEKASEWTKVTSPSGWLHSVPVDVVGRLRALQPFVEPTGFIAELHALDIADKHRGLLPGAGLIAGFRLADVTLVFGADSDLVNLRHEIEAPKSAPAIVDGATLARVRFNAACEGITRSAPMVIEVDFVAEYDGWSRTLFDIAHAFPDQTLRFIDYVRTGLDETGITDSARAIG